MPHGAGSKKRKRSSQQAADADRPHPQAQNGSPPAPAAAVDTSRPTAIYTPTKGRPYTLSIALPGSIIGNCLTHDLKTLMAGQIARAAAVFSVDEVVIFDDGQSATSAAPPADGYSGFSSPGAFLEHVLAYLETPPYLRRALFGMHPNLRTAGALPSVDMPHHLKRDEGCGWREGVVTQTGDGGRGSRVDVGVGGGVEIADQVEVGSRVTVRLGEGKEGAQAVRPEEPREEGGYYWGYQTRVAGSLAGVFTECPFDGGYDVSVGTSERGRAVEELARGDAIPRDWQHLVIVFGGVAGLEAALQADRELLDKGVVDVKDLFDHWVNLVPGQGSRTIRTEEAVWLGLMGLRQVVVDRGAH